MSSVRRCDAVEVVVLLKFIVVRAFRERAVVLRAVESIDPGALHGLQRLGDHLRISALGILGLAKSVLEVECEIFHLLGGRVARPAQAHHLLEGLPLVIQEVDDAFLVLDEVLGRVRGIAALQHESVILLAGHIKRCQKRVRPAGRLPLVCKRADEHGGHREEQGSLVEIVDRPQFREG